MFITLILRFRNCTFISLFYWKIACIESLTIFLNRVLQYRLSVCQFVYAVSLVLFDCHCLWCIITSLMRTCIIIYTLQYLFNWFGFYYNYNLVMIFKGIFQMINFPTLNHWAYAWVYHKKNGNSTSVFHTRGLVVYVFLIRKCLF